jgi:hypothetical protein
MTRSNTVPCTSSGISQHPHRIWAEDYHGEKEKNKDRASPKISRVSLVK